MTWKKRALKDRVSLASVLTRWRRIRKMTQQEMCTLVGSDQAQLSRIESGTSGVSVGMLLDMARTLEGELMFVPMSLKDKVVAMVERHAQELELDLGHKAVPGRKRGTPNIRPQPMLARMGRNGDQAGLY